ncbi:MAG: glycosyltransferase family 2 protein [candidate division KSB1 bacterium]|nr:glycosyltransferase family 2 protein [candidate division KSB1 bacterium]
MPKRLNFENQTIYISGVIPLWNERESLDELYAKLTHVLEALGKPYELIFVDDGSRDGSFEILQQIHRKDPRVKVIQFQRNYGKSAALSAGFARAAGEVVITMDADLQDEPEEIPKLLQKLDQGYDLVSGWKKNRQDPFSRKIASQIFNRVTSWVAGIRLHDFNCGFKIYRQQVIKTIRLYGQRHRFIPVIAHWEGFQVSEVAVQHHKRKYGRSKFGPSRFTAGLFDLITIVFLSKFKKRPLHLFGIAGLVSFLAGLIISIYLTIERLFASKYLSNRPLLFLGILLIIVGIQFVSIGLLGEMITETQKEHQGYLIKSELGF